MPTCPQIFGLAWSPNGQQLATLCKDGRLRVYEPRSGPEPLQVSKMRWGGQGVLAGPHVLYPNRKAQGPKGPVEPALSGCVMVTVCWYLALTGEDSGTVIPVPRLQQKLAPTPHLLNGWILGCCVGVGVNGWEGVRWGGRI